MMKFDLKKPCSSCPFRKTRPFPLREGRVRSIIRGLYNNRTFACHNTTSAKGRSAEHPEARHCAGALLFLERRGFMHQMGRLMERIGLYKPQELIENNKEIKIYRTLKGMVRGCSDERFQKYQERKSARKAGHA